MRITLNLEDDIVRLLKTYAQKRSLTMGKAVSQLVHRGLSAPPKTRVIHGIVVFDIPKGSQPVTSEHVKRLEAEDW
jgi:hypothetical protein